jgi:hypothetical protein
VGLGDTGTGGAGQLAIANQLVAFHETTMSEKLWLELCRDKKPDDYVFVSPKKKESA